MLLFGGYGSRPSKPGGSEDDMQYCTLSDLVVLYTDALRVEQVQVSGAPQPAPRSYCSFTTLGSK